MKVYELIERLAGMEAGADVFVCGDNFESECLELLSVTKGVLDCDVTIWVNGVTHVDDGDR